MYIAINISHPDSKGVPNIPKIETSVEILDIEDGHLWETGNSKELVQHVPRLYSRWGFLTSQSDRQLKFSSYAVFIIS
jgi:hypothetical protein